jgi:hypothetical protein
MKELFTSDFGEDRLCQETLDQGTLNLEKAKELFYQVGDYYPKLKEVLAQKAILTDFPALTSQKVKFVSSAYGLPYPLAAWQEYETVLRENDRRRLSYFKLTSAPKADRGPASESFSRFKDNFQSRCSDVHENSH